MKLGFLQFGLSPQDFWAMTLREFSAALTPEAASLNRQDLSTLMQNWPDQHD